MDRLCRYAPNADPVSLFAEMLSSDKRRKGAHALGSYLAAGCQSSSMPGEYIGMGPIQEATSGSWDSRHLTSGTGDLEDIVHGAGRAPASATSASAAAPPPPPLWQSPHTLTRALEQLVADAGVPRGHHLNAATTAENLHRLLVQRLGGPTPAAFGTPDVHQIAMPSLLCGSASLEASPVGSEALLLRHLSGSAPVSSCHVAGQDGTRVQVKLEERESGAAAVEDSAAEGCSDLESKEGQRKGHGESWRATASGVEAQGAAPAATHSNSTSQQSPVASLTPAEKKLRRLAANREAARRMRRRQSERLAELEAQIAALRQANEEAQERLLEANERVAELEEKNARLEKASAAVDLPVGIAVGEIEDAIAPHVEAGKKRRQEEKGSPSHDTADVVDEVEEATSSKRRCLQELPEAFSPEEAADVEFESFMSSLNMLF